MRASELLAARVVDAAGAELGPVRDVRLSMSGTRIEVAGVVVGDGRFARLAHATGVAEGRVQGPWVLRRLCDQAVRRARVAPASVVTEWGPEVVRLSVTADRLVALEEWRHDEG